MIEFTGFTNKGLNLKNKMALKENDSSDVFAELLKGIAVTEGIDEIQQIPLLSFPVAQPLLSPLVDESLQQNSHLSHAFSAKIDDKRIVMKQQAPTQQARQLVLQGESLVLAQMPEKAVNPSPIPTIQLSPLQQEVTETSIHNETEPLKKRSPLPISVLSIHEQKGMPQQRVHNDSVIQPEFDSNHDLLIKGKTAEPVRTQHENGGLHDRGEHLLPLVGTLPASTRQPSSAPLIFQTESAGKFIFETPVRATHVAEDISMLVRTAIDVKTVKNGVVANFTLSPEHLGTVDVKVSLQDGKMTAEFLTSTLLGKDLLESQVQVLRSALEQQGFQVDKINITQQQLTMNGTFSQRGDSQSRQGQHDSKKRSDHSAYIHEEDYYDHSAHAGDSTINTTA
ncbi:flagellar hook-length control protein FliK [Bacillus sp. B15-48]|uniref:flagellar hook-length control protein FliK n=1 Tax=Bacillus sp. B15-48 TaxID=1548601 RepID=UPI0019401D44|nr:flagellar hook-length control protein FliK [Bacillus sp. B15-48]MBM4764127.1 hypothetical protein [Bacillus sp. B15-48]